MVAADINLSVAKWTMYRMSRTNHSANKVIVYLLWPTSALTVYCIVFILFHLYAVYGDFTLKSTVKTK